MKPLLSCTLHLFTALTFFALAACSSTETSTSSSSSGSSGSSGGNGSSGSSGSSDTGNSEEGEALFAASGDATPDEILGVWANPSEKDGSFTFDSRMRFSADTIEAAARCTRNDTDDSLVASVAASGRVSSTEVAVLEAKSDKRLKGDFKCEVNLTPRTTKACKPTETKSGCFVLEGTTLTIYGASELEKVEMTKVSD